jgi:hypothetical protein
MYHLEQDMYVSESPVEGLGVFVDQDVEPNTMIGVSHLRRNEFWYEVHPLRMYNHSEEPNCRFELEDNLGVVYSSVKLSKGDEILIDYRKQSYILDFEQPEDWRA